MPRQAVVYTVVVASAGDTDEERQAVLEAIYAWNAKMVADSERDAKEIARQAGERLARRIAAFDDEKKAYESRVGPLFAKWQGDYDHLARVREWSASGWRGGGE